METRKELKTARKAVEPRKDAKQRRFQIVKLEQRITPGLSGNHNETLVRDVPEEAPKRVEPRKDDKQSRFQIVKLEQRITPGFPTMNHNETLVRDTIR
jgi:hypothetical protein